MNDIRGGTRSCSCSCAYESTGGSSSSDNRSANYDLGDAGGYSTSGCNAYQEVDVTGNTATYYTAYCDSCTA